MSLTTSEMTPADIAAVTGNSGNNGGNDGWGGNNGWWIIILLLALGRGWGGNGGGYGGGQGGGSTVQPIVIDSGRSGGCGCGCSPCATQADLAAGFNNSAVLSNLNDLKLGQAGIQQTLCQGFNGVNTALLQGFAGVDNAVCNLGYNVQSGFNGLSRQIADCCCDTKFAIGDLKYTIANESCDTRHAIYNSTRDIIDNANANSRAILDFLTKDKIDTLQSENLALRFQASQTNQNAYIGATIDSAVAELIRRTGNDCPQPAYLVNGPTPVNFPTNCCGQVQFANPCNTGCGGSF